jgi:hypothetical protein
MRLSAPPAADADFWAAAAFSRPFVPRVPTRVIDRFAARLLTASRPGVLVDLVCLAPTALILSAAGTITPIVASSSSSSS